MPESSLVGAGSGAAISYRWLHNKSPKFRGFKQEGFIISRSFCGPSVGAWLSWVVPPRGFREVQLRYLSVLQSQKASPGGGSARKQASSPVNVGGGWGRPVLTAWPSPQGSRLPRMSDPRQSKANTTVLFTISRLKSSCHFPISYWLHRSLCSGWAGTTLGWDFQEAEPSSQAPSEQERKCFEDHHVQASARPVPTISGRFLPRREGGKHGK